MLSGGVLSLIRADAALFALHDEWATLWRSVPGATVFMHPAWLLAWWQAFGTGEPRVAVLRRDGQLQAVLPLYLLPEEGKLLPIGVGISDDMAPLLAPGLPHGTSAALLAQALAGSEHLACDLPDQPPGSALHGVVPPAGWRADRHGGDVRPWLDLSPGFEAAIPSRTRRKLRMNRNRAASLGGAEIESATSDNWQSCLQILFDLHSARWQQDGAPGVLADPRVQAVHRNATPALLQAGLLRLQVLRIAGRPAAAIHAWLHDGSLQFYLSGYAAEFMHCSPGSLLLGAMLEQAVAESRTSADFLRGNEAYKYAWGAQDQHNATISLRFDRA